MQVGPNAAPQEQPEVPPEEPEVEVEEVQLDKGAAPC